MKNLLQHPPKTAMEVFKMLPQGTLCEVINGVLYMSPSPFTQHQIIITELLSEIHFYLKSKKTGLVFTAPYDVYLDEHSNAVQPDIVIVLKENESIIKEHIHGVPDILIEVLSKGNENNDLLRKKELYELFKVKEYFIINPDTKEVIHYYLENAAFVLKDKKNALLASILLNKSFSF
jgi:Uma2 family endonuclease